MHIVGGMYKANKVYKLMGAARTYSAYTHPYKMILPFLPFFYFLLCLGFAMLLRAVTVLLGVYFCSFPSKVGEMAGEVSNQLGGILLLASFVSVVTTTFEPSFILPFSPPSHDLSVPAQFYQALSSIASS
jgi:hypothetical protein